MISFLKSWSFLGMKNWCWRKRRERADEDSPASTLRMERSAERSAGSDLVSSQARAPSAASRRGAMADRLQMPFPHGIRLLATALSTCRRCYVSGRERLRWAPHAARRDEAQVMSSLWSSGTEAGCPSVMRNLETRRRWRNRRPVPPSSLGAAPKSSHLAMARPRPDTPALPREHVLACDGRVGVPEE